MTVFLNGEFIPEEKAVVSVFDRGFLYGDGLFETMRVSNGKPFRWQQHWQRLETGAHFLKIKLPFLEMRLRDFAEELISQNKLAEALLRLSVSRGVGRRGYSPQGADHPATVMSLHPAPEVEPGNPPQWRVLTASPRLPAKETLAQYKTCNKLAQILARSEADAVDAHEALLLNTDGFVVEGSSSNLFWIKGERICTPPLVSGILAGVTRALLRELSVELGLQFQELEISPQQLGQADGVFLSLSSVGIAEVISMDGEASSISPLVKKLSRAYWEIVRKETSNSDFAAASEKGIAQDGCSMA